MPLDVDQYNIRRLYRSGTAYMGYEKSIRNELGNTTGYRFDAKQKIAYKIASLTQTDIQFYGETINRVSKKIEIPQSPMIRNRENTLAVMIDDQVYNISQLDATNDRRWYLYLEKSTKKGTVHNG